MSPRTWTSGGQWGGPMSNDGHSTAETECAGDTQGTEEDQGQVGGTT